MRLIQFHQFKITSLLMPLFFMLLCQLINAKEVVLQDNKILVAFDSETGALTKLEDKTTNWTIERRPELGISFRLFVPIPNRQYNFVLGRKQRAVKVDKVSENEVQIVWKDLKSEHGGILPIIITADVSLHNGALTFNAEVKNNSSLTIETMDYPYFGDFNPPSKNSSLDVRVMWYGNLQSHEVYPHFRNGKGYWGDFYPTQTFDSYRSLFCLIQSQDEGLYVEMKDPTQRYMMQYTFEQHPGIMSSITNAVSEQDKIPGNLLSMDGNPVSSGSKEDSVAVHLEFRTCHFIYAHPHTNFKLVPIFIQCYKGDWHSGVDIYKKWRKTWFKQPHIPAWIENINSWQQLQINSPAQDYRVKYKDLVKYGEECAKNGIRAIQLVGWNKDGQDGNDPLQDTDPGLGTRQQLKDAIAQIQAMGVKIILFGKLNWADKTTEAYKKEFYKYAATDPYGIPYEQGGYSYYTPVMLAGINNHRRAVMDFQDPDYREAAVKEFEKLLGLGASGWLFDENCHHGPVKYSFAPNHGYTPPGFIYGGDMKLAAQLRTAADKVNRNFLFAGEGHQDWLMQYYPCSYFRIDANSTPVARYIDPQAPLMVAVTGFDDRQMLNLILMDRYIISYEPYNFKGYLSDFPLTLAYGKKIDELRRKYKEYLWDADFQDTEGAKVTADGPVRYSVFVTKSGKKAVVVVNPDSYKAINAKVEIPNAGKLVKATPEKQNAQPTNGILNIPARSAVVVMEQ